MAKKKKGIKVDSLDLKEGDMITVHPKEAKLVKKTMIKKKGAGTKQDKLFTPGEDYAAYEKRIKALLKMRRGLISQVKSVKKDLEWLILDSISHFEYKTDLKVKKIDLKRNSDNDVYNVELEIGF